MKVAKNGLRGSASARIDEKGRLRLSRKAALAEDALSGSDGDDSVDGGDEEAAEETQGASS